MTRLKLGDLDAIPRRRLGASAEPTVPAAPGAEPVERVLERCRAELAKEAERRFSEARAKGYEQGSRAADTEMKVRIAELEATHAAAVAAVREEVAGRQRALESAIAELSARSERLDRDAEAFAVELAYSALTRILESRHTDRALLAEACAKAAREAGHSLLRLRVPSALAAGIVNDPGFANLEVIADPSLQSGQCILETSRGELETGLEARLEALKNSLLKALASSGGDGN